MPLPLFFIGAALATGAIGGEKTIQAAMDNSRAKKINMIANDNVESARTELERQRQETGLSLDQLGKIKLDVLDHDVLDFVTTFEKIKNTDFQSSIGLDELKDLHIDQNTFTELKELGNFALEVAGGASAGAVGGALTAIGAYGAATTFASASTGTAISTLSGIAAQNATLAFFGGGSLASGGLGMAGGMMVANKAQADEIVESLNAASYQCSAIRRRSYMFYNLLAHMDSYFLPQVWKMQDIVASEGIDYRAYTPQSKKCIATAASTACTIKAILDTPILTAEGELTEASQKLIGEIGGVIYGNSSSIKQ